MNDKSLREHLTPDLVADIRDASRYGLNKMMSKVDLMEVPDDLKGQVLIGVVGGAFMELLLNFVERDSWRSALDNMHESWVATMEKMEKERGE